MSALAIRPGRHEEFASRFDTSILNTPNFGSQLLEPSVFFSDESDVEHIDSISSPSPRKPKIAVPNSINTETNGNRNGKTKGISSISQAPSHKITSVSKANEGAKFSRSGVQQRTYLTPQRLPVHRAHHERGSKSFIETSLSRPVAHGRNATSLVQEETRSRTDPRNQSHANGNTLSNGFYLGSHREDTNKHENLEAEAMRDDATDESSLDVNMIDLRESWHGHTNPHKSPEVSQKSKADKIERSSNTHQERFDEQRPKNLSPTFQRGEGMNGSEESTVESRGSGSSGLSQRARDRRRLDLALDGRPKLFSKAAHRRTLSNSHNDGMYPPDHAAPRFPTKSHSQSPTHSTPLFNPHLSSAQHGRHNSADGSHSTDSNGRRGASPVSDLSYNIPKAWGRKAKTPGRDWLARINEREIDVPAPASPKATLDSLDSKGPNHGRPFTKASSTNHNRPLDAISPEHLEDNPVGNLDDFIALAAQTPLPSDRKAHFPSSESSAPVTAHDLRSTGQDSVVSNRRAGPTTDWMIDDGMKSQSIHISDSPHVPTHNATLDRLRQKMEQRKENDRQRSDRTHNLKDVEAAPSQRNKDGKTPDHADRMNDNLLRSQGNQDDSPERPSSRRGLKGRLSPSKDFIHASSVAKMHMTDHKRGDLLDTPQKREEEMRTASVARLPSSQAPVKTPMVMGAWVDAVTPATASRMADRTAQKKTPFVTGGWVQTPAIAKIEHEDTKNHQHTVPEFGTTKSMHLSANVDERKSSEASGRETKDNSTSAGSEGTKLTKESNDSNLKHTGPTLPRSALDSVLRDIKGKSQPSERNPLSLQDDDTRCLDDTLNLGEATIQSLEELVSNEPVIASSKVDLSKPLPAQPVAHDDQEAESRPTPMDDRVVSHAASGPIAKPELQSYAQILTRLTSLAPSLRDSRKQLASLERALTHPSTTSSDKNGRAVSHSQTCQLAGSTHNLLYPCSRCSFSLSEHQLISPICLSPFLIFIPATNSANLSSTLLLRIPLPRLWTWPTSSILPRLTVIGLLVCLLWTLIMSEYLAQLYLCHPLLAPSMHGYGVDIRAPQPPFVFAKVIWQFFHPDRGSYADIGYRLIRQAAYMSYSSLTWALGVGYGEYG